MPLARGTSVSVSSEPSFVHAYCWDSPCSMCPRVPFSSPSTCQTSCKWVPVVKPGVTCKDERDWPSYLAMMLSRMALLQLYAFPWLYMFNIHIINLYLISLQFDLYCDREPYAYLATSLVFLSWGVGAFFLGWLTDRWVQLPSTSKRLTHLPSFGYAIQSSAKRKIRGLQTSY